MVYACLRLSSSAGSPIDLVWGERFALRRDLASIRELTFSPLAFFIRRFQALIARM